MLIGGLSVGYHGYVRATKDVDVLIATEASTLTAVRSLLQAWGATHLDGSAFTEDEFDGTRVIVAETPFGRLDLLPEGEPPLDYASLRRDASESELLGVERVPVVSLAALVTLKRLAGRPEDQRDLERLETAHGTLPSPLIDR